MYGMGQNPLAMPTILQGAAYRETLSPEQLSRLESQGIPTAKASVNVSSVLPMLVIGGIAAWFLARGTKRRSLWVYIGLLMSGGSMLSAQSFTQTVVEGSDTFTVYGSTSTVTNTTVTIDSIVKKVPIPPPVVVLGRGYGPTNLLNEPLPYTPFTADGGASSNRPQWLLDNLAKARTRKVQIIPNLPCGAHSASKLGNCLAIVNGIVRFSKARFDSAVATYNIPAVRTALANAYKDSVLIAVNVMDEPWVTGGGDGNTWGPVSLSRALVDSLCMSARLALGNIPIGTSDQIKWAQSGPRKFCDVGIFQFSYRLGQVGAWRDSVLTLTTQQGYAPIFSFNWINGGTQDRDGTWNCAQQGGVKGTRSPNCTMTTGQYIAAGTALGGSGCGALLSWRYDKPRQLLPQFPPVFNTVADLQAQRAQTVCVVRQ